MSAFSLPPPPTAEEQRDTKLKTVFAESEYKINTTTRMRIKFYEILDSVGKNCIIFTYYTDTDNRECIYINGLSKCALNTGTKLLTKIEEFARLANIKCISLEDASVIEPCNGVRIKLYYLSILCTGQSWYNKHGYISENHSKEIAHNRELIKTPMVDIIKNDEDYLMLSNILNPDAEEPDVQGTVQEVFVQLKNYLIDNGDNCSERIEDSTAREQSSLDPVVYNNIEFIGDLIESFGKRYINYKGYLLSKK